MIRALLKTPIVAPRPMRIIAGLAGAGAVYAATLALLLPVMNHIALNGTDSVKAHVLWKTPGTPIARGDYVLAPASHPLIPESYSHLTKYALCVEGDILTERDGAFFCNGELIHRTKKKTRAGTPLEPFKWSGGPVPEGKIFIGSRHPDGFDSRYLGLFAVEDLIRLEKVL